MAVRKIKNSWWVDFGFNCDRIRKRSPDNSRAGAQVYESVLRQKLARGESLKPAKEIKSEKEREQPFGKFAWQWFNTYVKTHNKHSEVEGKKYILQGNLIPFFGSTPIYKIDTLQVDRYKAKKLSEGLAPKSINNYLTVLRTCLHAAQDWLGLEKIPKIKLLKTPPPITDYLSEEESILLLANLNGIWREIVLTALRTGLRIGEIKALSWSDIDWENKKLTVRHSWCRYKRGLTTPKSNRERYVPLTDDLYVVLARRKKAKGLIFYTEERSRNFDCPKMRRALRNACKSAGIKVITFHTLRHTFASQLVMKGASLRAVQELMGHSDIRTTMRYAHLSPSSLKEAVSLLEPKIPLDFGQQAVNSDRQPIGVPTYQKTAYQQ